MGSIRIPRTLRHHGATGKTLLPTLIVGTLTDRGPITQVRKKKKYPCRYLVNTRWLRPDQFVVVGTGE
jgi:hypothetical protein